MRKAESLNNAATEIRSRVDQLTESLSKSLTETKTEIKLSTPSIAAIVLKVNESEGFQLNVASAEGSDITLQTGNQLNNHSSSPTKSRFLVDKVSN